MPFSAVGQLRSIQLLRFVAAFGVVVYHANVAQGLHAFDLGAAGVHVFFVISGFVMALTGMRSTPSQFLERRLLRIYPIYWLLAAVYLVAHIALGTPYSLAPLQTLGAFALWPGASSLIIGPGWTLAYEMFFYLCFAAALFAGVKRGLILLTVAFAAVAVKFPLLLEFIAGGWLGYAYAHGWRINRRLGAFLVLTSALIFVGSEFTSLPSVVEWATPSVLLVAGALAFQGNTPLSKLGDSSYFLYLSHVLAIDLLMAAGINGVLLLSVICTAAAFVGYEVIERPLLQACKSALAKESTMLKWIKANLFPKPCEGRCRGCGDYSRKPECDECWGFRNSW